MDQPLGTDGSLRTLGRAFFGQLTVVHALVLRETRTRYGQHQLGYAWALLEPVIMVMTFFLLFHYGNRPPPAGMDIFGFLATGFIPYTLFAKSVAQISQSINGNKGLLFYPQVKSLDVVIARITLEFSTYVLVFLILMGSLSLYLQRLEVGEPLLIVMGFALACLLGASLGLVFMSLSLLSKVVDRARSPLLRPFFWISGLFFSVGALPEHYRDLVLYNPVLHCIELVRAGWYPSYSDQYCDPTYVLLWILGFTFVGLGFELLTRRRIQVT